MVRSSTNDMIATRLERTRSGAYKWKKKKQQQQQQQTEEDDEAMDDDEGHVAMMDDEDNIVTEKGGTQPGAASPAPKDNGEDMLVYKAPEGGGPALLVPGMLLQNRAMVANGNDDQNDTEMADAPSVDPKTATGGTATAVGAPPAPLREGGMGTRSTDVSGYFPSQQVAGVALAPAGNGALPRPPPGFDGFSGPPGGSWPVPNGVPFEQGLSVPPYDQGLGPPMQSNYYGSNSIHPMFQQQASLGSSNYYGANMGESLQMFGGNAALQTKNPFAVGSMPLRDGNTVVGLPLDGGGGGGGYNYNGSTDATAFLHQDSTNGNAESSLLGSGLLNSLWMDDGADKTRNPFAT